MKLVHLKVCLELVCLPLKVQISGFLGQVNHPSDYFYLRVN